jgi:hypothetical protein
LTDLKPSPALRRARHVSARARHSHVVRVPLVSVVRRQLVALSSTCRAQRSPTRALFFPAAAPTNSSSAVTTLLSTAVSAGACVHTRDAHHGACNCLVIKIITPPHLGIVLGCPSPTAPCGWLRPASHGSESAPLVPSCCFDCTVTLRRPVLRFAVLLPLHRTRELSIVRLAPLALLSACRSVGAQRLSPNWRCRDSDPRLAFVVDIAGRGARVAVARPGAGRRRSRVAFPASTSLGTAGALLRRKGRRAVGVEVAAGAIYAQVGRRHLLVQ